MSKNYPKKPPKEILEKINQIFTYNYKTGVVSIKARIENTRGRISGKKVGEPVGTLSEKGYLRTQICHKGKRKNTMVHLIAWYLYYGEWPVTIIDHKDGNSVNNKIKNLRKATHAENLHNAVVSKSSKTGVLGVSFDKKSKKYRVVLRGMHLGFYPSLKEASLVRKKAENKHYKDFAPSKGVSR